MSDEKNVAWYITDDRDLPLEQQKALCIFTGGNGDWYVQINPARHPDRGFEGVRLCTSGGASSHAPGLTVAIAEAFQAMLDAQNGVRVRGPTRAEMQMEIDAWRRAYPDRQFDGVFDIGPMLE